MSEKDFDKTQQMIIVQEAMQSLVEVLFHYGFTDVRVADIMRLFGSPPKHCNQFKDFRFVIRGEILDMVHDNKSKNKKNKDPFAEYPIISDKIH